MLRRLAAFLSIWLAVWLAVSRNLVIVKVSGPCNHAADTRLVRGGYGGGDGGGGGAADTGTGTDTGVGWGVCPVARAGGIEGKNWR